MDKILDWIFGLFDSRSDFQKQQDEKNIKAIQKLSETHHIAVSSRGGISIHKKE